MGECGSSPVSAVRISASRRLAIESALLTLLVVIPTRAAIVGTSSPSMKKSGSGTGAGLSGNRNERQRLARKRSSSSGCGLASGSWRLRMLRVLWCEVLRSSARWSLRSRLASASLDVGLAIFRVNCGSFEQKGRPRYAFTREMKSAVSTHYPASAKPA